MLSYNKLGSSLKPIETHELKRLYMDYGGELKRHATRYGACELAETLIVTRHGI